MYILEAFEVTENTDKTEGRGSTVGTGICFLEEKEAIKFVVSDHYKPYSPMGFGVGKEHAKYNVEKRVLAVYQDMVDYEKNYEEYQQEKILKAIKDKLTEAELEILENSFRDA